MNLNSGEAIAERIENKGNASHWMKVSRCASKVKISIGSTELAISDNALLLQEFNGESVYPVALYIPRQDVQMNVIQETGNWTTCPLKGKSRYFDATEPLATKNVAWSYEYVLEHDPKLKAFEKYISFDSRLVEITTDE